MNRLLASLLLFAGIFLPLQAETVLQQQADQAQNFLEKTLARMKHAWAHMQYHFSEGNLKLKETAKNIPAAPPQKQSTPIRENASGGTPQFTPQINVQITPQFSAPQTPAPASAPAAPQKAPAKTAPQLEPYELPPIPEVPEL